jgi:glyoxylase-like metal-dependent hydrolase (beta-lactamase superfamily II)
MFDTIYQCRCNAARSRRGAGDFMAFLTEPGPIRGVAQQMLPGIRRIVAANPGVMTYHGTNTYLIDGPDGLTVLDPGPDDAAHVAAILDQAHGPIARILLSHTHHDHVGGLAALKAATGAPTYGFHFSALAEFAPDHKLHDGGSVAGWTAIHTPGHAADHLCFAGPDGVLFSADHVMGWSSSVVSPPNGDMAAYFASLERLLGREDRVYLPGHGPMITEPRPFVRDLLAHRQKREAAIEAALREAPKDTIGLVNALYSQVNPTLRRAAERNVIAHLQKLLAEGRARRDGELWRAA